MSLIEQYALQFTHHYFGTSIEMGHSKCQLYFAKEIAPQWRKVSTNFVCVSVCNYADDKSLFIWANSRGTNINLQTPCRREWQMKKVCCCRRYKVQVIW